MNRTYLCLASFALLLLNAVALEAQEERSDESGPYAALGAQLSYALGDEAVGIGPRVEAGLRPLSLAGSFDYFFPRCGAVGCSLFQLNGSAKLEPGVFPSLRPYAGGGIGYRRFSIRSLQGRSVATGSSLHALAGFWRGSTFVEGRYEFGNDEHPSQWVLSLGVLF